MSMKSFSTSGSLSVCGTWHCVQKYRRGDTVGQDLAVAVHEVRDADHRRLRLLR